MNVSKELSIGTGAYFPIELTDIDGKTSWKAISGDIRLINQNLMAIFNTQLGELIRNENFGSRLWECLEEPNTQALNFLIELFCRNAIESWESRIKFLDSSVNKQMDKINISLHYALIEDQTVNELNFSYNPNNTFTL